MRVWLLAAAACALSPWPQAIPDLTIRYVANAGMLVTMSGSALLVDAPIRDGIPPYPASTTVERQKLESARLPYDGVDNILVTHWHEDHFDPGAIAAHLASNPRGRVISSPEVIDRVIATAPDMDSPLAAGGVVIRRKSGLGCQSRETLRAASHSQETRHALIETCGAVTRVCCGGRNFRRRH
jgi:hypothetical protein